MEKQKIDALNRSDFINNIVELIEVSAKNKGHRTFAIDGEWGSGKTWVLEEVENALNSMSMEQDVHPFLVIHYNCWEYDYYQEPLLAIVSALLNFVEKTKKIPSKTKGAVLNGLKSVGGKLLSIGSAVAKPYIRIDIEKGLKAIKKLNDETVQEYDEIFKFDQFYEFKETLLSLKKELVKLSKKYTIVFCVDELDRCLPEYAIKVLERVHHVFNEIDNLQVVLSIDKAQLEQTVKTIFGENVNVSGYLTKFIDFTISLPIGELDQEKFRELFSDYMKNFDCNHGFASGEELRDFLRNIFAHTNIRRRIKIVEKATLVHSLMPADCDTQTADALAIEIFFVMVSFVYGNLNKLSAKIINNFHDLINPENGNEKELQVVNQKVFEEETNNRRLRYASPQEGRGNHIFNGEDIWGLLYAILLKQFPSSAIEYEIYYSNPYNRSYINLIISYAKKYFDILKMIS